ncbi:MAG: SpoIIE family protein phosphatase [Bacteroidetes bacterium]|nr:SpoIIE family protein phosphatase [Bacteroidota bacterium]
MNKIRLSEFQKNKSFCELPYSLFSFKLKEFCFTYLLSAILFNVLYNPVLSAQNTIYTELGLPLTQNFTPNDYKAFPQNWSISQFPDGRLISANGDGFLTFDGENWSLLRSKSSVRVVFRASNNRIYVGLKGDFGYLDATENGSLQFVSLRHLTGLSEAELSDVSEIAEHENAIIFKHDTGFFSWDEKVVISQRSEKRFIKSFKVYERYFVLDETQGLLEYKKGTLTAIPFSQALSGYKITGILADSGTDLFIITEADGFFILNQKGLISQNNTLKNQLKRDKISNTLKLSNGNVAIGTINNGLYLFNEQMDVISHLTMKNGLIDNTIISLYEEMNTGAIWLASEQGLTRISTHLSISQFGENMGISGSVNGITRFSDQLYIATSQGVSVFRGKDALEKGFVKLRLPISKIWDIDASNSRLIIAADEGLVLYRNGFLQFLDRMSSFCISPIPTVSNKYVVGRKEGVFLLDINNPTNPDLKNMDNSKNEVRSMEWDKKGRLWLGLRSSGTQRVDFSEDLKTSKIVSFDTSNGLPDSWLDVAQIEDQVVFLSSDGIYGFNEDTQGFYKLQSPTLKGNAKRTSMIFKRSAEEFWLSDSERRTYAYRRIGANEYKRIPTEVDVLDNLNLSANYVDSDGTIWLGHSDKLYRINPSYANRAPEAGQLILTEIIVNDSVQYYNGWGKIDTTMILELPSDYKNLRISFSNANFDANGNDDYQFRFSNLDEKWSKLSKASFKEFSHLPSGVYTLEIRAVDIFDQYSKPLVLPFKVKSGLVDSWYSYIVYLLALILFTKYISDKAKANEHKQSDDNLKRLQAGTEFEKSKLRAETAELRSKTAQLQAELQELGRKQIVAEPEVLIQEAELQSYFQAKSVPENQLIDISAIQKTLAKSDGDYYDFLERNENDLTIVIGDASKRDHDAGLLVASTKAALIHSLISGIKPSTEFLNKTIHELTLDKEVFMALALAHFSKIEGQQGIHLQLTGGAIPPIYILRANGSVEEFELDTLPLGASSTQKYSIIDIDLFTDDLVILHSDGLPKRLNSKSEALGNNRLHKLIRGFGKLYGKLDTRRKAKAQNVAELMVSIGEKWSEGTDQNDDVTVLIAKVK